MTLSLKDLVTWCDNYLHTDRFHDYCPNGLQVEGKPNIRHLVTGVTASQRLIDAAIAQQADAIMVHHGYFWKGERPTLTGMKGRRIRSLCQHNISLLAYHLPLDAHDEVGNNAVLIKQLGWQMQGALDPNESPAIGRIALCPEQSVASIIAQITAVLGRTPMHLAPNPDDAIDVQQSAIIRRIGICSGAAQDMIELAATQGCDLYLSGEVSERTTHIARELGIHYLACGHHATERGGIKALGELIAQTHDISVTFIDDDNPV